MIVGSMLVGTIAGLLAFFAALLSGASFWIGFSLYVLTGAAVVILLPVAKVAASIFVDRDNVLAVENY